MSKQANVETLPSFAVKVRRISAGAWAEDFSAEARAARPRGAARQASGESFPAGESFPVVVNSALTRRGWAERLSDESLIAALTGGADPGGPRRRHQANEQITRRVGGTAPRVTAQPPPRLVLPRSTTAPAQLCLPVMLREGLVELRAELLLAAEAERLRTVLVSGVEPGDGASFVAWHLSRLCAEFERLRVALLLVEGRRDVTPRRRLSSTAEGGGAGQGCGLMLRRTEAPNLHEVVSPRGPLTLAELLAAAEPGALLAQMKRQFDLIVIDGPSVAASAEAALLAAQADGVILVARRNVTPLRRLDRAHRRLSRARARVLGIVFNRDG
jgi:Mrp family chromosome partitioning ATPase